MRGLGQLIGFLLFVLPAVAWQWLKGQVSSGSGKRMG